MKPEYGKKELKSQEECAITSDLCMDAGVELRAGGQRMKQETSRREDGMEQATGGLPTF